MDDIINKIQNVYAITEEMEYYLFYRWAEGIYCKIPMTGDGLIYRLDKNCEPYIVGQLEGAYSLYRMKIRVLNIGCNLNNPEFRPNKFRMGVSQKKLMEYMTQSYLMN